MKYSLHTAVVGTKKWLLLICFSLTIYAEAQIKINEIVANNATGSIDPHYKLISDWFELYNSGDVAVNLNGYYLTDNPSTPAKWKINFDFIIQPKGYAVLWADGKDSVYHPNFKLSADGEFVGLYSPLLQVVDSLSFGLQLPDISIARQPDGGSDWQMLYETTPGFSNNNAAINGVHSSAVPVFSVAGGSYISSQTVSITSSSTTGIIRYTINGKTPDTSSVLYSSPLQIDSTTVVKAIVFDDSLLPGTMVTQTYLINENIQLPVISLSIDPLYLWDNEIGMYCLGNHTNYYQDWERPATFEYIDSAGTKQVAVDGGLSLMGRVRYPQKKSFEFFARKKYGAGSIDYPFFKEKKINSFSSIFIRNGGLPDLYSSMLRDALIHSVVGGHIDIDYMAYTPVVLFLNGAYWGIYNIREKMNEDYLLNNYKVPGDKLNLIENRTEALAGDTLDYTMLMSFLEKEDITQTAVYAYVKKKMDIQEYINYQATEIYSTNLDWPGNNIKFWRTTSPQSKWRWMLFDLDAGQGMWWYWGDEALSHAADPNSSYWSNPPWSTFLFRRLLENDEFKHEFIQSFAHLLNTTFSKSNMHTYVDSLSKQIEGDMPRNIERWKSADKPDASLTNIVQDMDQWAYQLWVLKHCAQETPPYQFNSIKTFFNLQETCSLTVKSNNGHVFVEQYKIQDTLFSGRYFKQVPMTLVAVPEPGYRFLQWTGVVNETNDTIEVTLKDSSSIEAVFVKDNKYILPKRISNDTVLSIMGSPYLIMQDIVIDSNVTLTVEAGVTFLLSDTIDVIVHGKLNLQGTIANPILFKANDEIHAKQWGAIRIINATDTSVFKHVILENVSRGDHPVNDKAAVSVYNSDVDIDDITITDAYQPFFSQYGNYISIKNSSLTTSFTGDLINIKYAAYALVDNCNLKGNDAYDTDAIDYDNIAGGIISNNLINGFYGDNSDGIDIGEGAQDILIQGNRFYNCFDKGISVGQASTAIAINNVFVHCNLGVGVKDAGSHAQVENNTFYLNNYAVACYEKNLGDGGGSADVKNCILYKCKTNSIMKDSLSAITISYSLTDNDTISGLGNITGNPLFTDTLALDLSLKTTSPCINSGDPASPKDKDNSVIDMGAYMTTMHKTTPAVVISEINYNSLITNNPEDWIELYNCSAEAVDISGWVLKDENEQNRYVFPQGAVLCPNEFIVVTRDKHLFANVYPGVNTITGNMNFNLGNDGDAIRLYTPSLDLVDQVIFDDTLPWPVNADGMGYTIEFTDCSLNNALSSNWQLSDSIGGTPGSSTYLHPVSINNPLLAQETGFTMYPNPATNQLIIENEKSRMKNDLNTTISIKNTMGQEVLHSSFLINNSSLHIDVSPFAPGLYIVRIGNEVQKLIIQR